MLRKVMVGVIAVSIVAAGCSSDPTQSDEYQQLESQLTEVQSQVADAQDAASETAAATQAELEGLRADVARLDGELTEADANNLAVSEAMVLLTQAFETVVALDLWIALEDIQVLHSVGVDTSVGDRIVNDRGWSRDWEEFSISRGGFTLDRLIAQQDDEQLELAWLSIFDTESASDEEFAAFTAFSLRLYELLFEQLDETTRLTTASP